MWWFALACGGPPPPLEAPSATTEGSLYELELHLETSAGPQSLDVNRGHPVLVTMFYASCPNACPMTIAKLRGIESRLSPDERADLRVLLVSLDPERDTPQALDALRTRHALDDRWTLARVPEDEVRELSAALGIKYRRLADGDINHSTVITLLDAQGLERARVESLGASDDELVDTVRRL